MTSLMSRFFSTKEEQKDRKQNNTFRISDNEAVKNVTDFLNKKEGGESAKIFNKGKIKVVNLEELGLVAVSTTRYFFVSKDGVEETEELSEDDIMIQY